MAEHLLGRINANPLTKAIERHAATMLPATVAVSVRRYRTGRRAWLQLMWREGGFPTRWRIGDPEPPNGSGLMRLSFIVPIDMTEIDAIAKQCAEHLLGAEARALRRAVGDRWRRHVRQPFDRDRGERDAFRARDQRDRIRAGNLGRPWFERARMRPERRYVMPLWFAAERQLRVLSYALEDAVDAGQLTAWMGKEHLMIAPYALPSITVSEAERQRFALRNRDWIPGESEWNPPEFWRVA